MHEALFYVKKTIEEGWSRNALDYDEKLTVEFKSGLKIDVEA